MMNHVEEPPNTPLHPQLTSKRWKILLAMSMVGLILLSSLCYFQYQTLIQLSAQFLNLKEQHEEVQDVLKKVLGLENAVYTYKYTKNGTLGNLPWPLYNICSIYSLLDNSTLEMTISFPTPNKPPTSVYAFTIRSPVPSVGNVTWLNVPSNITKNWEVALVEVIRFISIANNGSSSAILPSKG